MRGEVDVLVTGLSVGVNLYKNEFPLKLANTYVSGLSYLVTNGEPLNSFAELKGRQVTVPFAGSPIEEVCQYLAAREGLKWGEDITPVYAPFESSITLLKEGKAGAVILPEPSVSLVEGQPGISISFSLYDQWNRYNAGDQGYPQVGTFVNADWAARHVDEVTAFNTALAEAISIVQTDPAASVKAVADSFKLPAPVLQKALTRTQYHLYTGAEMRARVEEYYQAVGKPLDEKYTQFYFFTEK
jgi:NitT/TauT family transport system substrate-binding protein